MFRPSTLVSLQFELDIGASHFRTPDHMPRLHLMTFNLKTGEATRTRVHSTVGDFPQSPGHMLGALAQHVQTLQASDLPKATVMCGQPCSPSAAV